MKISILKTQKEEKEILVKKKIRQKNGFKN
jgi:hypothetical protein